MNGRSVANTMGKQKCLALNRDSLIIHASETWWGEGNWSDVWPEYEALKKHRGGNSSREVVTY